MILLRLPGFKSIESAMERSREIARETGFLSPNGYWFKPVPHGQNEWALEINPGEVDKLTNDERERLIAIQYVPVQLNPTPVYRYMAEEYIEQFFSTGAIRLSSFEAFSRHPNEKLRDPNEGGNILCAVGENSTVYTRTEQGQLCLILSTSYAGPWSRKKITENRTCFEITHPWNFAMTIASALNGCDRVILGACAYVPRRSIMKNIPGHNFVESHEEGGVQAILGEAEALIGDSPMFRKPLRYQSEQEFRFVWQLNRPVTEPVDLLCPDANQFCRKLTSEDFDDGSVCAPGIGFKERVERIFSRLRT